MRNLSKSKIIAYRQCPKRLWLEIHKPELRDDSASEMVFQIGNQVGDMARTIYDLRAMESSSTSMPWAIEQALARSAVLLKSGEVPVFEAGMAAGGALAYADVMLPDPQDGAVAWKMIEVKSSTSVKDYHRDDIAVQAHIAAIRRRPAYRPFHWPTSTAPSSIQAMAITGTAQGKRPHRGSASPAGTR